MILACIVAVAPNHHIGRLVAHWRHILEQLVLVLLHLEVILAHQMSVIA